MNLFDGLNNKQQQAVKTTDGPVLILAGAGSGKTTVLVNRIAYILDYIGEEPYNILAITFTNKAANEMKERIRFKIGEIADNMWIGTFHSICVRILRTCIDRLGYSNDFVIYDTADSKTVLKECYKDLNIDEKMLPLKSTISEISKAKDNLISPELYEKKYEKDFRRSKISKIYSLYQKKLKKNNALDFDDIIVNTIKIFKDCPDILEKYSYRFKYIMVDEYQDTNNAQYMLISLLASTHRNLCVVGDDDQSIYKFRGANIRNILDFEKEFDDAAIIKLEQNYRSTQNILNSANAVISNNKKRKGKNLWTEQEDGDKIHLFTCTTEHDEGKYIADKINEYVKMGGRFSDCAVLYRMNAQSRVIEEMFIRNSIPYRVLAGLRFYDRKEIKDIISYMRVVHNPNDDVSLRRIINEPKRSIGSTTLDKAQTIADYENISIYEVISNADQYPDLARAESKLRDFVSMIDSIIKVKNIMPLSDIMSKIINDTGYIDMIKSLSDTEATTRIENIDELFTVISEYEQEVGDDASISGFLESVSLVSDIDNYDEDQDSVVLMTIHSAKGLEFPVVFLPGMENGIFPGSSSLGMPDEIEEERRLCYVAITRAKKILYMTRAEKRMIFGKTVYQPQSIFLKEIPTQYLDIQSNTLDIKKNIVSNIYQKQKKTQIWTKPVLEKGRTDFCAGDKICHKKFGKGTIIKADPIGTDTKLEIIFDDGTKKILMAAFAKLEKL